MSFSLVGSVVSIITTVLRTVGLPGLLALMIVESFGLPPIPSEVILPFAGFLVATGDFALLPTIVVALAGGLIGSYAAYAVGRWWRHRLVGAGVGPMRLQERHLQRMDTWFAQHGEITVALARCVPVVRAYISYPAGTARMDPKRFGAYTLLGALPFTLALLYAGIVLGSHWGVVEQELEYLDYAVYAGLVILGVYLAILYRRWVRAAPPPPNAAP